MKKEIKYRPKNKKEVIPKEDTRPGTGLKELDGRAENIEADEMLGEGD